MNEPKKQNMSITMILILLLIGAAAGFASGFVGVGGGDNHRSSIGFFSWIFAAHGARHQFGAYAPSNRITWFL